MNLIKEALDGMYHYYGAMHILLFPQTALVWILTIDFFLSTMLFGLFSAFSSLLYLLNFHITTPITHPMW